MKLKPEFHYDTIVVGSGLSALLYAYLHDYPVVFKDPNPPFFGDVVLIDEPEHFGYDTNKVKQFKLWTLLHIILGMRGLLPTAGIATGVRVEDNYLKVSTTTAFLKLNFKNLIVFEPEQLNSFDYHCELIEEKYEVYDWFLIKEGARWEIEKIDFPEQKHINQIWFHDSVRTSRPFLKDCVVRSYLTKEELDDESNDTGLTRVKTQQILRKLGTEPYLVIEFDEREIKDKSIYKYYDKDNIKFITDTAEQIWNTYKTNNSESMKLCIKMLTSPVLSQ
jgi:hypothetical protein